MCVVCCREWIYINGCLFCTNEYIVMNALVSISNISLIVHYADRDCQEMKYIQIFNVSHFILFLFFLHLFIYSNTYTF